MPNLTSIAAPSRPAAPVSSVARLTLLFDGECPLCRREINFLSRIDRGRNHLAFIDIAAPGFDPARFGRTMSDVMGQMHGVLPNGSLVTGMEAFRLAYAAVGWGWLLAPTGWSPLKPAFDAFYRWFARNRYRLKFGKTSACDTAHCKVP